MGLLRIGFFRWKSSQKNNYNKSKKLGNEQSKR